MELCEMIKVMQHYQNDGDIEFSRDNFKTILGTVNKKYDGDLSWNWSDYNYRIKPEKQKVTIEKWLIKDARNDEYFIYDSSMVHLYLKETTSIEKVKLLETYEVEL